MRRLYLLVLLLLLALPFAVQAQTTEAETDPNANISWPPPVYVMRGEFTLRGSANVAGMTGYYLEYRQINDDLTLPELEEGQTEVPWTPATLPTAAPVLNDVLGVWDTTTEADGIYELRLVITLVEGDPITIDAGPVRIENEPSPFAQPEPTQEVPVVIPTVDTQPAPQVTEEPAAPPPVIQPTQPAAAPNTPRVETGPDTNANVRSGDGLEYPAITALRPNSSAPVLGISSRNNGWLYIEVPSGGKGWVSPAVVTFVGEVSTLPRMDPPPPPAPTQVPQPTAVPTTASNVNLVAGEIVLSGGPVCNETFNIFIDVANFGTGRSPSGSIGVSNIAPAGTSTTVGAFGEIEPGQTVRVGPIPLTVSVNFGEEHTLRVTLDPNNLIPETNEGDNTREYKYTLQRGSC
jgi:hypothetical protein